MEYFWLACVVLTIGVLVFALTGRRRRCPVCRRWCRALPLEPSEASSFIRRRRGYTCPTHGNFLNGVQ
jgi:hypothetical protein